MRHYRVYGDVNHAVSIADLFTPGKGSSDILPQQH